MRVRLTHEFRYLILAVILAAPLRAELYHEWCAGHFDGLEIAAGLASPLADGDRDGCSNLVEYLAGTDPRDGHSLLAIERGMVTGTVGFLTAVDREDVTYEVVVSDDLVDWWPQGTLLSPGPEVRWDLGGYSFVKVGVRRRAGYLLDSDRDGLDDLFEESLVAADSADELTHIGAVHPEDDFDGDGTLNRDEEGNAVEGSGGAVALVNPAVLNVVLAAESTEAPSGLEVHTPLQ